MAEGYAWATGRVGVCIATSGPGATNLVTPLADALIDSVPLVAITGQVPTHAVGNDAFQEAYTTGITMPATKHNYFVTDVEEIPDIVHEAFHIAATGRPGPVLVDVPKDVLNRPTTWREPSPLNLPGYKPTSEGHPKRIREAVELIAAAQRPVLYVGGGVIKANAHAELRRFAELAGVPVTTTLMGRGAIPDDHPLALGMPGMHGTYTAITALQKADLLIADRGPVRRPGDRQPSQLRHRGQGHPRRRRPGGDRKGAGGGHPDRGRRPACPRPADRGMGHRDRHPTGPSGSRPWRAGSAVTPSATTSDPTGRSSPSSSSRSFTASPAATPCWWRVSASTRCGPSQFWRFTEPRRWINSGGLGTMGFAVPAAIGAKAGTPDELVYAIDGDGCFQMTLQELITAATEEIPIKVGVINNGAHGMVKQWQKLFYGGRLSASLLGDKLDYPKLAEAMGCVGLRAETPDEVGPAIEKSLAVDDRPVVVEFVVDPEEMVFPMVPAGGSNDDVILGPEGTAVGVESASDLP